MKLTGTRTFRAPPEALWDFLLTPERLRDCLPGCERFEATGSDSFAATMRLGIGVLKGTYTGTIRAPEQRRPQSLVLVVDGGGALGSLIARGLLTFSATTPASTFLTYDGDA